VDCAKAGITMALPNAAMAVRRESLAVMIVFL
jgi:hypothetical protein